MQALMGKSSKPLTPQELYRARKQREEEERNALLPPGFINHGNTCFMNSVLQGLMATPMLADIVRFTLPETFSPILARRSPQLTNGHGLSGPSEHEWEEGMPLGDTFVVLMYKAWKAQEEQQRITMSPKELLSKIGAKYDQYLDFRQQDAHELLRHLLDAMRMEEMDIIKERQPPPPKVKRKRKSKAASASNSPIPGPSSGSTPSAPIPIPEEDQLMSFVDMVFGGQLASILVCEKCKKVSFNYEDFDDLSLPIKQEDYEKARKRDKIRSLARRFGLRGRVNVRDLEVPEGPRSSSVPSSPLRRSEEAEKSFEIILNDRDSRRLSLEHGDSKPALPRKTTEETIVDDDALHSDAGREDDKRYLSANGRDKDEDSWIKLRRRLSAGVKKGSRRRSKEIQRDNHPATIEESDVAPETDDAFVEVKLPTPMQVSPAASPKIGAGLGLTRFPFQRRASSRVESVSPAVSVKATPAQTPNESPLMLPPSTQPTSPSLPSVVNDQVSSSQSAPKAKMHRPSKLSRSDSHYLKRLLADVPAPSGTTFNLFKNMPLANSSPDISDMRGSWSKAGHVQSIEGCLRMFTSVEILEGENMVGCRRCWKIQHGQHVPKDSKECEKDDAESEDEDREPPSSASSASVKIKLVDDEEKPQGDDVSTDNSPLQSISDVSESQSLRSISTHTLSTSELLSGDKRVTAPGPLKTASDDAPLVPLISMTPAQAHAVPHSDSTLVDVDFTDVEVNSVEVSGPFHPSSSRDSLQLPSPQIRHLRMPAERNSLALSLSSDASSLTSDESADDEPDETETSLTASLHSESSLASTDLHQHTSEKSQLRDADTGRERASARAKQVILRRAFKRYLISKPPPVLVVHLKRFQQSGRSPTQYYSIANLSKMDEPVSFSEYLDISPFLLPKKDVLRRGKGKDEEVAADDAGCIYRLYAVVVHIGNMLGGHYIAYVALPDASSTTPPADDVTLSSSSSVSRSIDSAQSRSSAQQRFQIPRTTSFARTANPPAAHRDKSRTLQSARPGAQRQWCYVSDTTVRLVTLEEVLQSKAYICMYERLYL